MNYFEEVVEVAKKIENLSNHKIKCSMHIERDCEHNETFYVLKLENKKENTEFIYYDLQPPRFELLIHHLIFYDKFRKFTDKIIKTL